MIQMMLNHFSMMVTELMSPKPTVQIVEMAQ